MMDPGLLLKKRLFGLSGAAILLAAVLLLLFALPGSVFAESRLLILLSEKSGAYVEVAQAIQAGLNDKRTPLAVDVAGVGEITVAGMAAMRPNLLVAVGLKASEAVAKMDMHPPVLNLLLPRQSYERVLKSGDGLGPYNFSAIYLDQPYGRQLDLIKLILPGRMRVGVLSGVSSKNVVNGLAYSARQKKLQLVSQEVTSPSELLPMLKVVLSESDVLLAIPEPSVFNNSNIQGILLTTYHYGDPVIAFSPAYVRAGALAAVYSTPNEIGAEAAELIRKIIAEKTVVLPLPQYPRDFTVSVNHQVARSLGIAIDEEPVLYEKLKRSAEQEQSTTPP